MKLRQFYLLMAFIGVMIPLNSLWSFLASYGANPIAFADQMFASPVAAFFSWDVLLSSVVLIVFIVVEGRRRRMQYLWMYILFDLLMGISLALPAFLYGRQLKMDRQHFVR